VDRWQICWKIFLENKAVPNSGQAQFGHLGRLMIFVSLYLYRRLKNLGHQSRTAPARETLAVRLKDDTNNEK